MNHLKIIFGNDCLKKGIAPQNTDGQFKDDSDTANIAGIKLSDNLGSFNEEIEEGGPTARKNIFFLKKLKFPFNYVHYCFLDYKGRDLVSDETSCVACLKLGPVHLKYQKLQGVFRVIVENIYFELFIAFCIVFNTIILSIQYYSNKILPRSK